MKEHTQEVREHLQTIASSLSKIQMEIEEMIGGGGDVPIATVARAKKIAGALHYAATAVIGVHEEIAGEEGVSDDDDARGAAEFQAEAALDLCRTISMLERGELAGTRVVPERHLRLL